MSSAVITAWRKSDLPAIRMITWETWISAYGSFIPAPDLRAYYDEHYSEEALLRWMEEPGNRGYLAASDGAPAGYMKTRWNAAEGRFYLSSLYVLPRCQGKGVGRALMSVAEGRGAEFGEKIWLGVMEQNVRTLEWYREQGFRFVEEAPFCMGQTTVNHLIGYKLIRREQT